jgi:predicted transposase YbfD/YdcC
VFAALKPGVLVDVMRRWSGELSGGTLNGKQVAIDGKTLRRSFDSRLGQERPAPGQRLVRAGQPRAGPAGGGRKEQRDHRRARAPEDAGPPRRDGDGGRVEHADRHRTADRHRRRRRLPDGGERRPPDVVRFDPPSPGRTDPGEVRAGIEHVYHETTDGGHGRIDTRRVWATGQIDWLDEQRRTPWKGLASVVVVESTRKLLGKDEQAPKTHRRYFIASVPADSGERLANLIRNHWSIENAQHWSLDVAFNEDQSRVRKDHGDQNLAVLRRIALGLLRRDRSVKLGAKNKRLKAGRNPDYLLKVLLSPTVAK